MSDSGQVFRSIEERILDAAAACSPDLRERLACCAHEVWSGWMRFLFSRCEEYVKGDGIHIPQSQVYRWRRQTNTPYANLPEG